MTLGVALTVLWAAALHRLYVAAQLPRLWRVAFAAAVTSMAAACTLYFYGGQLGFPVNADKLVAECLVVVGCASAHIYVDTLRHDYTSRARLLRRLLPAGACAILLVATWALAPVHDQAVRHLAQVAERPGVVEHLAVLFGYTGYTGCVIALFCLRQVVQLRGRPSVRARQLSLAVIGTAGALAAATMVFLAGATAAAATSVTKGLSPALQGHGELMVAWTFFVLGGGVLSLSLVVPWLVDVAAMRRRWRALSPLWSDLTRRHPDVVLAIRPSLRLRQTLRLREQRALVEIHDALAREGVPGAVRTTSDLAAALRFKAGGPVAAASLMPGGQGGAASDLEELLALAEAYGAVSR
jgi:hypothetical protein